MKLSASEFQEMIVHTRCLGAQDFHSIFGEEMGSHLWRKFFFDHKKDVGRFIGELDNSNMRALYAHLLLHVDRYREEGVLT